MTKIHEMCNKISLLQDLRVSDHVISPTDNAWHHRAADILLPSLITVTDTTTELVSPHCSHWHFQTYPINSRWPGRTKMSQKVN